MLSVRSFAGQRRVTEAQSPNNSKEPLPAMRSTSDSAKRTPSK